MLHSPTTKVYPHAKWSKLLCCILALALCACEARDAAQEGAPCVVDDDCGYPFICVYGACFDGSNAALQNISLEVIPSSLSETATQQFRDYIVSGQSRSEIVMARSIDVHLDVEDEAGQALASLVTAQTPNDIPGRVLHVDERSGPTRSAVLGLVVGRSYSLRVLPDDKTVVPFRPDPIFANSDIAGPGNSITLASPAADSLVTISGKVVVSSSNLSGMPHLQVQVLGPVGTPAKMRVISTTDMTSNEAGSEGLFAVQLPGDIDSGLTLRIAPTQDAPYRPLVEVTGLNISGDTNLGPIAMGDIGSPIQVSGTVTGPNGPVPQVVVTFTGQVGEGRFARSTTTQAPGTYQLDLLAGVYTAVASPPESSSAGLSETPQEVVISLPGQGGVSEVNFVAQPRASIRGVVKDVNGSAINSAVVRATRLGNAPEAPGPGDDIAMVFETRTDMNGRYRIYVDRGYYELSVIPPRGVVAPRSTELLTVGSTDLIHDTDLRTPAPFGGKVTLETGGPALSNALVRAFIVLNDEQPMLVGEELTDNYGQFAIVLPLFQRREE